MAENKMAQVAAMFCKKLGERFMVKRCDVEYDAMFTPTGFRVYWLENPYVDTDSFMLMDLLTGRAEIVED